MSERDLYQETLYLEWQKVKIKKQSQKAVPEKQLGTNKGNTKQQSADFLVKTLHARWEQHYIIKIIKEKKQSTSRDPILHKDIIQIEKYIVLQTSKIKKEFKKKRI